MADTDQQPKAIAMTALPGEDLPLERKFYFNGFTLSLTPTDVMIAFMQEGKLIGVGTTSYTTAKTMAVQLTNLIDILENKIGIKVLTHDEMMTELTKQITGNE